MESGLYRYVKGMERAIVCSLFEQISQSNAPHYRESDDEVLWMRCKRVVQEFVEAIDRDPMHFADYVRDIAADRIEEGFQPDELQMVLGLLETDAWKLCRQRVGDRDELVSDLVLVNDVIGNAKNQLIGVYAEMVGATA